MYLKKLKKSLTDIDSFLDFSISTPEFEAWISNTTRYLENIFEKESSEVSDFKKLFESLYILEANNLSIEWISAYGNYLKKAKILLRSFIEEAEELKTQCIKNEDASVLGVNKTKVFIVHGHDDAVKIEMARVLEKLKLEAVILHEKASSGSTIIEKIEDYSDVGFAIILYTACDVGGKDKNNLKNRARQNLVLEHGFFMGKLGRANVATFVKGNIETPSDIGGVVYSSMDNGDWKLKLVKELKSAGYNVDANDLT